MFETLIREAASRFHLGDNAGGFVRLLVDAIFDDNTGGFAGMRHRFDQAGLGDLFTSWIGKTPGDNVLQPDQFDVGFGDGASHRLANTLGIPMSAVNMAGAYVLPKLIGLLTPGGAIPTGKPAGYDGLFGRLDNAVHDAGARAHATAARVEQKVEAAAGGMGWMKWAIALAVLAAAFFLFRNCNREATPAVETPAAAPPAAEPAPAPVAQGNSTFNFAGADGKVTVSGRVPSDADKTRLWDALTASFGAGNVSGDVSVDANTLPAGWMDKLIAALPELKDNGLKFGFDGDKLNIDTSGLPDDQRFALSDKLRGLFGGFEISGLWDRASAALSGLQPGASVEDTVKALNLMNVYFETGSATITRDSQEILGKAAEAIKAMPAGTKIEVGGHTDNTGNAAANQTLSQQRADAVVARLGELGVAAGTLTGKGYGQDQPRADNGTEQGRAQNRRIEFSVAP